MVSATSDHIQDVAVHAATLAQDGSLRVMLVNKAQVAKKVHLNLGSFIPLGAAKYEAVGNTWDAKTLTINGQTLSEDDLAPSGIRTQHRSVPRQLCHRGARVTHHALVFK